MAQPSRTGVYFCCYKTAGSQAVDITSVLTYIKSLPTVALVKDLGENLVADPQKLTDEIKENQLDRLVIAGDTPGFLKTAFTKALVDAGGQPENIFLASFRRQTSVAMNPTECAKAEVACAVYQTPFELVAQPEEVEVNTATLVIGGGIAGIQASLDIANAGHKVYLVEKSGTIGGHMALFDKTFPTLDCAACILTPKMVEVGQHPNIELLTLSEVKEVNGEAGSFKVKVLQKARRVDLSSCTSCGECAIKCPGRSLDEFNVGISKRSAIYMPFPQAVPNKYLIDPEACIYVLRGKCKLCLEKCPTSSINLDEKDAEVELDVGNIIVATGFKTFDAARAEQFGFGQYQNVITSLQFERFVNASGPTGGKIKMSHKEKKQWVFDDKGEDPKSVAIIHCVGSRDRNYNRYCSRVCCMYSLKFAHLVREKLPDAEVYEYYIDMRCFGKGYEEFYERIREEGVHLIRGRTAKVNQNNGQLLLRSEDMASSTLIEQKVDMVVLAVGLEPSEGSDAMASMLGISSGEDGWLVESNANTEPVGTARGGIFLAGACQAPKDIPDTVAQASAAASRVLQSIARGKAAKSVVDMPMKDIERQAHV